MLRVIKKVEQRSILRKKYWIILVVCLFFSAKMQSQLICYIE